VLDLSAMDPNGALGCDDDRDDDALLLDGRMLCCE
jgi:hypothetical protein